MKTSLKSYKTSKNKTVTTNSLDYRADVIIVSYHTGEILFDCIKTALELEGLNKIILINNGNKKEVEDRLIKLYDENPKVTLVSGHGNIGFAKACNLGAKKSNLLDPDVKYLLFLNPDCTINDKLLLKKLQHPLEQSDSYKVSTCQILNSDGTVQKTCRRNLLTPLVALSASFNLYKISKRFKPLNLPVDEIKLLPDISEIPALSGALVFTTKEYYAKIGGFDEGYFLHVEDMDFCMKIHMLKDKIAFVKNAQVTHLLSTSDTTNRFLEYQKAKGFIIYMQKFFPQFNRSILGYCLKSLIWARYFLKTALKT